MGKDVTVTLSGSGGGTAISGRLLNVSDGMLIIQAADGTHIVSGTNDVKLDSTAANGMSPTAALLLSTKCTGAGQYTIKILYQTGGWSWHPTHSVVYDPKTGKITTFDSSVAISNNSGASYAGVTVNMVYRGLPGRSYGGPTPALAASPQSFSGRAADAPAGAVQNVGEQKMYTAPAPLTIASGQSQQVPLFQAVDVPVAPEYIFDASSPAGTMKATLVLNTVNDAQHHLGKPLPGGELRICEPDSTGALKLMPAGAPLPEISSGQLFCINMGASSDIKGETAISQTAQKDAKGNVVSYTEVFTVTLHNYKDSDTQVTVNSGRSSAGSTVLGGTAMTDKDGNWVTHVNVRKGSTATVTFTIKTPQQ